MLGLNGVLLGLLALLCQFRFKMSPPVQRPLTSFASQHPPALVYSQRDTEHVDENCCGEPIRLFAVFLMRG